MRARFSYPLLFLVPAAMVAAIVAVVVAVACAGVLWLFVYGDHTWPRAAEHAVMGVAIAAFLSSGAALSFASYSYGRKREPAGGLSRRHVALAGGVSVGLAALVLLQQWSVGNIRSAPDNLACPNFCTARKFNASSAPGDGTCRCYAPGGREALRIPVDRARAEQR